MCVGDLAMEITRRKAAVIASACLLLFLIFFTYLLINPPTHRPNVNIPQTSLGKVAFVDQLSFSPTGANQAFIQTSITLLETAGFNVTYYKGQEVTVDFYMTLPLRRYSLIVLRVHSAVYESQVALFTSEPYLQHKYSFEDQALYQVAYSPYHEGDPTYFGVKPEFVREFMKGKFDNATIIVMGCNGLTYSSMAEAFIEKGAKVYVGWDGLVTASHTDQATAHLLESLVTKNQTIEEAVNEVMNEVGSDPEYESVFLYYPPQAGSYRIQRAISSLIAKVAQHLSDRYLDRGLNLNYRLFPLIPYGQMVNYRVLSRIRNRCDYNNYPIRNASLSTRQPCNYK